jgi:hypothetical protein
MPPGMPPGNMPPGNEPPKTFKAKAKRAAIVGGTGAALILYWLLFGFGSD